jgi:hypothetical protein
VLPWFVDGELYFDPQFGVALLVGSVITVPLGVVAVLPLRAVARRQLAKAHVVA